MNQAVVPIARAMRAVGPIAGVSIVAMAYAYFLKMPGRPDATEVLNLWLLVGFEVGTVSFGLSWVLEKIGSTDAISTARPQAPSPLETAEANSPTVNSRTFNRLITDGEVRFQANLFLAGGHLSQATSQEAHSRTGLKATR
jgi:hypothetical protein